METIVGVFRSIEDAREGGRALFQAVPAARLRLVASNASVSEVDTLPTDEGEQPGMGAAIGGVVGGVVGAAAASLLVPPAGAVALLGLGGGALLGLGGGVVAGDRLENALTLGLPRDELFVYEDALSQGRALAVAVVDGPGEADAARTALAAAGAESLDAARDAWWVGLRDGEEEQYQARGLDFQADEPLYRRGFGAALADDAPDGPAAEIERYLARRFPDAATEPALRRGYERGRRHRALVVARAGETPPSERGAQ